MKRILSVLLVLALAACLFAGCAKAPKDETAVRIGGLKGPTSMGMVSLMDKAAKGEATGNYSFTIAGSADELTPKLLQGELDMAALPANLAAVLYNNTDGKLQMLAVHTLGILYIVTKNAEVGSIADLKGRTIYASGKGSSPEYVLNYLLTENGLDPETDVTVEWKSEHSEVVAAMNTADSAVGLLPQPFVTVAAGSVEGLTTALDLTAEWDKLNNGSQLVTGVLAVRTEFAQAHPQAVATFLEEYRASTDFTNQHTAEAAQLVEQFDILKAAVAEKAIPYCNITCVTGKDAKAMLSGYLAVLYGANPKSVGGALPGDDFYYGA